MKKWKTVFDTESWEKLKLEYIHLENDGYNFLIELEESYISENELEELIKLLQDFLSEVRKIKVAESKVE